MKDLIEALQIFFKYKNLQWPTNCEHDVLYIMGVTYDEVSEEDRNRLEKLGFVHCEDTGNWMSYRYGSA